jgi:hypothetical protein
VAWTRYVKPWDFTGLCSSAYSFYSFFQVELHNVGVSGETKIGFPLHCPKIYWVNLDEGPHFAINIDKAATDDESLLLTVCNPSLTDSRPVYAIQVKTNPLW